MDEMNVELWSRLPTEIVERTLSFLSVPVLCRFRTVCKGWNSRICSPKFGALCIQHARRDARFLVARYTIRGGGEEEGEDFGPFEENHGWSFLDLNERRWYTIKKDGQEIFDSFQHQGSVAMDGGLVCQPLEDEDEDEVSVFVSNPIAKTSRRLPVTSPYCDCLLGLVDLAVVDMVVDSVAETYTVFVMPNGDYALRSAVNPLMIIYESTSNQWRRSTHPPIPQFSEVCIGVKCSVSFNGLLYVLMCPGKDFPAEEHWLWSYNHVEDAWNDTGISIDLELDSPRLIVSDNRLFLGSWVRKVPSNLALMSRGPSFENMQHACFWWSYEISEFNVVNGTRTQVFETSGARFKQWVQDFDESADCSPSSFDFGGPPFYLKAFGFCKSIILLREPAGVSKVYDLKTCSWEMLPKNPLIPFPDEGCWLNFGKPMNLFLPASKLWEHA